MSLAVRLRSEAELEIETAAAWYRERSEDVADRFLAAVREALEFLEQFPNAGGKIEGVSLQSRARRIPVRTFPYHVVFVKLAETLEVIAVAHDRRRPGYWQRREPPIR